MFIRIIRATGLLLCAALLLGTSQCQNSDNSPNFVTTLSVMDANGNPSTSFSPGVAIQFQITVRNRSSSAQTLWFNTSEEFNFAVVDAGTTNVLWTSDNGGVFTPGFVSLTIPSNQTQTFTVSWNQTDDNGRTIASGNYEVFGGLTVCNTTGSSSPCDITDSMATGAPGSGQFAPTQYISTLTQFTIQ